MGRCIPPPPRAMGCNRNRPDINTTTVGGKGGGLGGCVYRLSLPRLDLCFGGFSTYSEPNHPLSSTQPCGAIEETGPFFALRCIMFRLRYVFALLRVP